MRYLLLAVLLVATVAGCISHPALPPTPTPPELASFSVTATEQNGLVPNSLVVAGGASLSIKTFDNDVRITSTELGIDTSIAKGETKVIKVQPGQPGTYSLTCEGCPAGKSTLTIEVR
jgi:hypothetical protein